MYRQKKNQVQSVPFIHRCPDGTLEKERSIFPSNDFTWHLNSLSLEIPLRYAKHDTTLTAKRQSSLLSLSHSMENIRIESDYFDHKSKARDRQNVLEGAVLGRNFISDNRLSRLIPALVKTMQMSG